MDSKKISKKKIRAYLLSCQTRVNDFDLRDAEKFGREEHENKIKSK